MFDHEGRPIQFDTWLDNLQLYLLSDSRDSVSLFDHTSGASLAPPATPDSATRSQWLTRDAAAHLAVRNHLPLAERAHFGQHKSAKALYDAVVARYSSPATAALGRLILPYLFRELSAFATFEDLITHLCTNDTRYRAALPVEFLDKNPPPMYITHYFIVTRLPDSLHGVRDHFLALDPTVLTVDLLEQHLLAAETSVVAIGAARGTPCTPFFEGCSPSPLAPSYASGAAVDVLGAEDVGAASASGKRRSSKGKGGRISGGGSGGGSGGRSGGGGGSEVVAAVGVVAGVGALVAAVVAAVGVAVVAAVGVVAVEVELFRGEHGASGGSVSCPYVICTGDRAGQTCGKPHTQHRCFSCLDDAWRAEFGGEAERPRWEELLRSGVAIFDLDYDAILVAMYALSASVEGDCYLCVPPDPSIAAATLGASESALPGTAPAEALHAFTLDSGASRCFFRDNTTLTPLSAPVRPDDPYGGPILPDPPLFSRVAASAQVSASGPVAAPCSCRLLLHQTLLWHHRLGHPFLPGLRGMHSRLLVSGLPRSLPPLPPSPAPPCLPCIEGRQRAAPHSSSFPPTTAPLQTLHMDVWGPARVSGEGCERYFLLVVDDYMRYTTVFPLCSKGESFTLPTSPQQNGIAERCIGLVMEVARTSMIHAAALHFLWPFAVRYATHQLNLWPRVSLLETLPTLRWTGEVGDASVFQFYHPTSRRVLPSQDVTFDESVPFYCLFPYRTAPLPPPPFFLAPGPRPVDPLPPQGPAPSGVFEVDPVEPFEVAVDFGAARGGATRGTASGGAEPAGAGPGGTAPACTEPGVADSEGAEPGGAEPERAEPRGAELGGAEPERAGPGGAEPERTQPGGTLSTGGPPGTLSRREPLSPPQPCEWFARRTRLWSGVAGAWGPATGGTGAGAAGGTGATGPGGACNGGTRAAGAGGAAGVGTRGTGAAGAGGAARVGTRGTGAAGAGGAAGVGAGGTGAGAAGGTGAVGPRGARTGGTGAAGAGGAAGVGAGDPGTGDTGVGGAGLGGAGAVGAGSGDTGWPRPYFVPLLQQVLGLPSSTGLTPPLLCPPPDQSQPPLQPASPLPVSSRYTEQTRGHTERRDPVSLPASLVCAVRTVSPCRLLLCPLWLTDRTLCAASPTVSRLLAAVVTDPSFESTAASALIAELVDFAAACRLDYATSLLAEFESVCPPSVGGECALGRTSLRTNRRTLIPPPGANIVDGMWIFRVKRPPGSPPAFKARYVAQGFSQRQGVNFFQTFSPTPKMTTLQVLLHVAAQHDYELHSLDFSTAFLQGNVHEEIWLRRPPSFTGLFPAGTQWSLRRPVFGLRQAPREWHDTLRTTLVALGFAPLSADPSLFLRTDTLLPLLYDLVYVDDLVFATADTEAVALVKSELQKRHTCTDLGELRNYLGLQITRDRPRRTITLTLSHMVHQVLQRFGFRYSSPLFTPLPIGHSLSAPPSDESVEPSGPYPELVGCLMYLMTCTRLDLASPLSIVARYVAPGRHRPEHWEAAKRVLRYLCSMSSMGLRSSQGYTFSLGSGSVSWRSIRSSSVLSSSCEAKIYAGAMAAHELRWLTYLLTDLGEWPRSSPVLYVDNNTMIALCQEHRLEHRTKHIALHYFLARELQQRGQLHLAYVATRANTGDIFTKALQSACFDFLDWSCDHLFSPTLPIGILTWDTIDWGNEPSTLRRTVYGPAPELHEPTFFPGTIPGTNIPLSTILDREFLALMLTTANGDLKSLKKQRRNLPKHLPRTSQKHMRALHAHLWLSRRRYHLAPAPRSPLACNAEELHGGRRVCARRTPVP
ncbi:unnamed protein product [Closterium sp. NIES-53]